jgi:PKD repeat protein
VGQNYSCLITTTGNPGPTITISGLSPGLSEFLGSYDTAWIVGVPTSSGTDAITITVTNRSGTVTQSFTLTIGASPSFTSAASATIPAKKHSSLAVTATGIPGPVVTASGLPSWLTLSTSGGKGRNGIRGGTTTLSAKHPAPGTYTFTLTATNSVGTTSQRFTLVVTG